MKNARAHLLIIFCLFCLLLILFQYHQKWDAVQAKYSTDSNTQETLAPKRIPLSMLLDSMRLQSEDIRIKIDKSEYILSVLSDSLVLRAYPAVFGTDPVSDKLMQGDRATPEGHFTVRAFYPHKSWSKFIWINYPTDVSWQKHNAAKAEGKIPQNAAIGGEIGIHGVPNDQNGLVRSKTNWTWGCISLTNADVNDLFLVVYEGMPVEITP